MTKSFLNHRPWLDVCGVWGDRVRSDTVLHADLYAWHEQTFGVVLSAGGSRALYADTWRIERDQLTPCTLDGVDVRFVTHWTRDNHDLFRRVHPALLNRARDAFNKLSGFGFNKLSLHCHYIAVTDGTPWPRGWLNEYRLKGFARSRASGALQDVL